MPNDTTLIVRNRTDREKTIKDAIFAFSGGTKSLLIKGEGEEISTAVEVAEILKNRLYPGVKIANVSLGSRPYFERNQRRDYRKDNHRRDYRRDNHSHKNKKDLISKIEITISKSQM